MKKSICLMLLVAAISFGQTKAEPTVSTELQLAVRNAQLQITKINLQASSLQEQWRNLQVEGQKANEALSTAIDKAYKDAKVKQEDYDLNLETLKFTARPKPQKPETKPEEKK